MSEATAAPSKPLDEFGQDAKKRLISSIEKYNGLAGQLKAVDGDPQLLLETLRDTDDNPEVAKLRQQIEQLDDKREQLFNKRDEILKPKVEQMRNDAAASSEGIRNEADSLAKTIKAATTYIKELYGDEHLKDLPDVASRKNRATPNASGEGAGKRIKGFDWKVNGVLATSRDAQGVERSNTAAAAKAVGVDTSVLQDKFFAIAGKDSKAYPAQVEFEVITGEGDQQKTFSVVASRLTKDETPQNKQETTGADAPATAQPAQPANSEQTVQPTV